MEYRIEHDSMGEMKVPADCYWGAQTQRSYQNFRIGTEKMPAEIIHAFAVLKRAAAMANCRLGKLDEKRCGLIAEVCTEIADGKLSGEFPLAVWQTGSGTQSNMNVNEVIANRGNAIAGDKLLHPNDTVNMSQSSNDTFPTAMHIAAVTALEQQLIPALDTMIAEMKRLEKENEGIVKSGRTHLQDAVPIAFSQEISGWRAMLEKCRGMIRDSEKGLKELALGGTAVGTGLNAPKGFAEEAAAAVSELTGFDFRTEDNKFHALSSKDAVVFSHGALKALAADLMKIANDVRWLASGPRCGIGEIFIPENEPGSSIMPGKVNPTQCEAVTMVAAQVMGHDVTIVEALPSILSSGPAVPLPNAMYLRDAFAHHGTPILTSTRISSVTDAGAVVQGPDGVRTLPADTVVIAVGFRPNPSLAPSLRGRGYEVFEIGDERQVGNILTAIWDAYEVAHTI